MLRALTILVAKFVPQETWQLGDKRHVVTRSHNVASRRNLHHLARFHYP